MNTLLDLFSAVAFPMQPGSKISGSVFTTHLRRCEEVFADFSRSCAKQIDKLSPVSIAGLGSVSCPGLGKTLRVRPPAALGCGGKDLEIIYIYIYIYTERERGGFPHLHNINI